jgi:hypothetical protein
MSFAYDPLHFALQKDVGWSIPETFDFLATTPYVAICPAELRRLASVLTIAVRQLGERLTPVVLVGDEWVSRPVLTDEGRWALRIMPQALAVHPFRLAWDASLPDPVVMVARDRRCVGEGGRFPFFTEHAQVSDAVLRVMRRLRLLEASRQALDAAARWLFDKGLLAPLPEPASEKAARTAIRARERFLTLDAEKFEALGATANHDILQEGGFIMRLAVSLRVSQQHLPRPLLVRLRPLVEPEQLARSVQYLLVPKERAIAANPDLPQPAPGRDALPFLVDDDAVLRFDFTASGSVFNRG